MANSSKNTNRQEVSFLIDGQVINKSITKYTTCADVINKFPKRETPIAVFESIDGEEKELPGRTKLLKVWRAHGLSKHVMFVIRKSDVSAKAKKSTHKLFSVKSKCDKPKSKSAQGKNMSKETLKKVSDLAFYIRYQKTKLQSLTKKTTSLKSSEQKKIMRRLNSKASVNSMDAFLAKTDVEEMARFLDFCGEVAAVKLGNGTNKKSSLTGKKAENIIKSPSVKSVENKTLKNVSSSGISRGLKNTKLGLRQKFTTTKKVVERTASTGTINSTDTGYHSVGSDSDKTESVVSNVGPSLSKPHTVLLSSDSTAPRHSTPLNHGRHQPRTSASCLNLTFEPEDNADELHGKTMILQKFMADQCSTTMQTDSVSRKNSPSFGSLEEKCRFYWESNCDSDSESECSEPCDYLDVAFIDNKPEEDFGFSNIKTLRRESAISDLNNFSLLGRDLGLKTLNGSADFDYTFDCSFPRMDESQSVDFSCDFSYSFDETDSEDDLNNSNVDDSMASFMNTKSFIDNSREITINNGDDAMNGSFVPCDRNLEMII